MQSTILTHPIFQSLLCRVGKLGLSVLGWKTNGEIPNLKKYILICAPHTSNWDFVFFLLMVFKFRLNVYWMGKATMFRPPFRTLLLWLGGIPIDRSRSTNTVAQMADAFGKTDQLIIALAPSGTRKKDAGWKTGFYHIAREAEVPIVCGYVDYKKRIGGIGPSFIPRLDIQRDLIQIQSFYHDKSGKIDPNNR